MSSSTAFGFEQLVGEILRGLTDAVADYPGETGAQRFARHQTTVFLAMAFMPRDALETMLAGQCIMFDHALRDGIRDLLRGQDERMKLRLRSQLAAIGRLFLRNLMQLRLLQARPVEQVAVVRRAAAEPPPAAEPSPAAARSDAETAAAHSALSPAVAAGPLRPGVQPSETPSGGKAALISQQGFQNRRARRALQFKVAAAARRALTKSPTPVPRSGTTGG